MQINACLTGMPTGSSPGRFVPGGYWVLLVISALSASATWTGKQPDDQAENRQHEDQNRPDDF